MFGGWFHEPVLWQALPSLVATFVLISRLPHEWDRRDQLHMRLLKEMQDFQANKHSKKQRNRWLCEAA